MSNNSVETIPEPEKPTVARRARTRSEGGPRASGVAIAALIISILALGAVFAVVLVTLHRQQTEDHPAATATASSPQQTSSGPATTSPAAPQSQPAPTPGAQAQRSEVSQAATDEAMQRELNMKLATDPELALHPLDATVQNGRVRLRGTLPSERLKERVESISRSIRGVKEVTDLISVQAG